MVLPCGRPLALSAMREETTESDRVCAGTLLSREQYLSEIQRWGYADARVSGPYMSPAETAISMLAEIMAVRSGRDGGRLKESSGRIQAEVSS